MAEFLLDPARIIYIYGIEGSLFIIFIILGIKILKREKQRLNLTFASFYLISALGILMNFIYVPLSVREGYEKTVSILNYLTIIFIAYSLAFLVLSQIIILKSTKVFNNTKQAIFLLCYAIVDFSLLLFYLNEGVVFSEETNWIATFSIEFYLYLLCLLTFTGLIPSLILSIKIGRTFENPDLKKRWSYFTYGLLSIFAFMFMTYSLNYLNGTELRDFWFKYPAAVGIPPLLLVAAGAFLIYYAMGVKNKN
jgi:hypothetical protein